MAKSAIKDGCSAPKTPLRPTMRRMTPLRLGLIGAAHIHTPGFVKRIQARGDRVTHIWDHDVARLAARAGELAATPHSELGGLLAASDVDAVIVLTETNLHEQVVLPAVAARKHIFVEKPLGFASADATRMSDAIQASGVRFSTGYFQRGEPINQFLRTQLAAGAFGKVTRIRKSNCHAGALKGWFDTDWRWMADPAVAGCGAFGDLGTHALDIVMWWMEALGVHEAKACGTVLGTLTGRYGKVDEYGEGLLRFANGTAATIAAGWVDVADPVRTEICGTEGHAVVFNDLLYFSSQHVSGADRLQPWTDLPAAWPHALDNWLDAVAGKPHAPLIDAAAATARNVMMQALYAAAAK